MREAMMLNLASKIQNNHFICYFIHDYSKKMSWKISGHHIEMVELMYKNHFIFHILQLLSRSHMEKTFIFHATI